MKAKDVGLPDYFDMQAAIGHTKHVGGWFSTQELAELCHLGPGQEVLYVGSGSGNAAVKLAMEYGCDIVGVDLLERMVEGAELRAREQGMEDQVVFQVADAQDLPFEDGRFDVVLCESVNTFVSDLQKAANEYVRVVKPGGYVGLNEAVWIEDPPQKGEDLMRELTGQVIRRSHEWMTMLEEAGLEDVIGSAYDVDLRREARSQFGFLGCRDYLRILGRFLVQFVIDPSTRGLMRLAFSEPKSAYDYMGYGIYVGRKPAEG